MPGHIKVTCQRDGFWRGGKQHFKEPKVWPKDAFTEEQLKQLNDEPLLTVEEVTVEEDEAAKKKAAEEKAAAEKKAAKKKAAEEKAAAEKKAADEKAAAAKKAAEAAGKGSPGGTWTEEELREKEWHDLTAMLGDEYKPGPGMNKEKVIELLTGRKKES